MIKVSVIIPVYNMDRYLETCLNSVLEQDLEEIEIICINDGSTDRSSEILASYRERCSGFAVVNQDNQGAAAARNTGLSIAGGEFVAFMDADDFYPERGVLRKLYRCAKENSVMICGGTAVKVVNGSVEKEYGKLRRGLAFEKEGKVSFQEYQGAFGFGRFIYQLDFLREKGIKFPLFARFEDPLFMLEAMIAAEEFYAVKDVVYCARAVEKKINFGSYRMIEGYMQCICSILEKTGKNELCILHEDMVEDIFTKYKGYIYRYILAENLLISKLAEQIEQNVRWDWMDRDGRTVRKQSLCNRKEMEEALEEADRSRQKILEAVTGRRRVIIYGTGMTGKAACSFMQEEGDCKDIFFAVTKTPRPGERVLGRPVYCICDLLQEHNDTVVLLSVMSETYREEMMLTLEKLGFFNYICVSYNELVLMKQERELMEGKR